MSKLGYLILGLSFIGFTPAVGHGQSSPDGGMRFVSPGFAAIRVVDAEAASSWYQRVFALDEVNRIDADDGRYSIRILSDGRVSLELIEERGVARTAGRQVGLFKVGFYVSDIDATHRRLDGLGVDQDPQIFVDEALNVRSFIFRDIEGNRIQLFQSCDDGC